MLALVGALGAGGPGFVAPAPAQGSGCADAIALARIGLITDAVKLFEAAKAKGEPCGTGQAATEASAAKVEAAALALEAHAAEVRLQRTEAIEGYEAALDLNRQEPQALDGLARLTGTAAAGEGGDDPFAGALELLRLGRPDAAKAAALAAIEEGATFDLSDADCTDVPATPTTDRDWRCELRSQVKVEESSGWTKTATDATSQAGDILRSVGQFFSDWWRLLAALAVVASLALLTAVRHQWPWAPERLRRPKRLLLATADQTGTDSKLMDSLATRVREDLARQHIQHGSSARYVVATDADVTLPDLGEVATQAKFLTGLWAWLHKQRALTLRISVLPPRAQSLSCHVVLADPRGEVVTSKALGRAERIITVFGTQRWDDKEHQAKAPGNAQIAELAGLVAAWTSFQYAIGVEGVRARDIGTVDPLAHSLFLEGVARIEHDPRNAASYFEQSISADPSYLDARLNRGHALELAGDHTEAAKVLGELQQRLRQPGTDSDDLAVGATVVDALSVRATATSRSDLGTLLDRVATALGPASRGELALALHTAIDHRDDRAIDRDLGRALRRALFVGNSAKETPLGLAIRGALAAAPRRKRSALGRRLERAVCSPGRRIGARALGRSLRKALSHPVRQVGADDALAGIGRALRLAMVTPPALGDLIDQASIGAPLDLPTEYGLDLLVRASYSRTFALFNIVSSDLAEQMANDDDGRALAQLDANLDLLDALLRLIRDHPACTSRGTQTLAVSLTSHVEALCLGADDLVGKRDHRDGERYPRLTSPEGPSYPAPRLKALLDKAERATFAPRVHYTLATVWARDARLTLEGVSGDDLKPARRAAQRARKLAAKQLDKAFLGDSSYKQEWESDPDFAPIHETIKTHLAEEKDDPPPKPQVVSVKDPVEIAVKVTNSS